MKPILAGLLLCVPLAAAPDGDPFVEGLRLYRAGRYAEAAGAFREALKSTPDDPRLNYNLALACWRAGEADAAETAAEKAAALSKGLYDARRDGILGSLRYDAARERGADTKDPKTDVENLEKAVGLATQARVHFQRGALTSERTEPGSGAVLVRNLERAIRLQKELQEKLEEAKKRREEQEKKDEKDQDKKDDQKEGEKDQDKKEQDKKGDRKPDQDKKDDQKKDEKDQDRKEQDEQKKSEQDQKKDQKPQDDQKQDTPEPDPKGKDAEKDKKPTPQPEEKEDEKKAQPPGKPQTPGEYDPTKELTPEQRRQLLKRLEQFEADLQQLKAARRAARPKVKKDW